MRNFRPKADLWLEAVREVCVRHGIRADDPKPTSDGSNLVAIGGQSVIKIFPPFHRHQWTSEWRTLRKLGEARLSVRVPELVASGERDDGWTYVVVTLLPGAALESVWGGLAHGEQKAMLRRVGELMAEVHAVPVGELADLEPEWAGFLDRQARQLRARHQRLGMPPALLGEAEAFVAGAMPLLPGGPRVILTGEYTPFNLLVERSGTEWRLTGMIDFGDAMIGPRDYDFLGPALFLGQGDPRLLEALLRGYGSSELLTDPGLRDRLMALALLHRYSDFDSQIRIEGWKDRARSLKELQALAFPIGMQALAP